MKQRKAAKTAIISVDIDDSLWLEVLLQRSKLQHQLRCLIFVLVEIWLIGHCWECCILQEWGNCVREGWHDEVTDKDNADPFRVQWWSRVPLEGILVWFDLLAPPAYIAKKCVDWSVCEQNPVWSWSIDEMIGSCFSWVLDKKTFLGTFLAKVLEKVKMTKI